MLNVLSHIVTYLFMPLLIPLLALYLAIRFDPYLVLFMPPEKVQLTLIVVVLATFLFPLINLFLLRKAGVITSYGLENRKERIAPAISTIVYFALGYYLIKKGALPPVLYSLYLGAVFSAVAGLLVTFRWKISLHAAGMGGIVGGLYGLFKVHEFVHWPLLVVLILITGLVMSARLELKVHTPAQVYAGAAMGFTITLLSVVMGVVV